MKRKFMTQVGAVCLSALVFIFTGCQDKDYYDPNTGPIDGDGASLLDYSTSQDVKLNATYDVQEGVIAVFDVYTENPLAMNVDGRYQLKSSLTPIAGGISVSGVIDLTKTIPAAVKELYIYSPSLFVPVLMRADIAGGVANFGVVDLSVDIDTNEASSRTLANNTIDGYLSSTAAGVSSNADINEDTYRPNYIVGKKSIPAKYINRIINSFPNETAVTNQDYYKDAMLYLYEPAELKLAMVHGDATYNNALSYFFYTGEPKDVQTIDKSKMREIVALPYAKLDKGVNAGDMVQLMYYDSSTKKYVKEFPAGTTVGFMLRSNAFAVKKSGPYVKTSTDVFYSAKALNSDKFQHTIFFDAALAEEDDSFYCFGFEDTKGGGDKDCNDVMFHVDVNPADAIEEPEPLPEVGTIIHTENRKGVLAFEDNWPWKGDYDMNDVVVNYTSKTTYAQATENGVAKGSIDIKSLDDYITLAHSGADFTNTFAYKMNIGSSQISGVTIDGVAYTPAIDGSGVIVKICDDVATEVQCVKTGLVYTCTPKTFHVKVEFAEESGITQKSYNDNKLFAPYNPFIIPDNKTGYEVHLPYYAPTSTADVKLFGTGHDKSDPNNNLWYVGSADNPYPFAIHLFDVSEFKKIPVEDKEIDYTYPKFTNWVSSKFTQDMLWFESPADVN